MPLRQIINNKFVITYLHDAYSIVKIFNMDGSEEKQIACKPPYSGNGFPHVSVKPTERGLTHTSMKMSGSKHTIMQKISLISRKPMLTAANKKANIEHTNDSYPILTFEP